MPPVRPDRLALLAALAAVAGCAGSTSTAMKGPAPAPVTTVAAPTPDPRLGLKAGWWDAGAASWNVRLVSSTPPSAKFTNPSTPGDERLKNSDLAFLGSLVFQGNYSGWQVWDASNPAKPVLKTAWVCPGSQSDVTVYGTLLFVSAEATNGRLDCGLGGVQDTVSRDRARGIRIYDISDVMNPKPIVTVQTCRGSHTNTLVSTGGDPDNVYIYVSGSAGVRSNRELEGCSDKLPDEDPNSALFRIEVIQVPIRNPAAAKIVSSPRIFNNLQAARRHGENESDMALMRERMAAAGMTGPRVRPGSDRGPTQCHDITAYPAIGLAGGACSGWGILLDIRDPKNPVRIGAVNDTNFAAWHSVTFANDGSKILFSDEWGGGSAPRCRATDNKDWGADAIYTLTGSTMTFQSYYKLPAAQTSQENCVAHNGSLIPVPGREVMVQSWYQGGISIFDWTDPKKPVEIAFFDRGPMDAGKLYGAGHWSAYWYNGHIYGSEIARGLDIWELVPSPYLTQNEIDAAKSVTFQYFNAQEQPKLVWPATFALARAYADQLQRSGGLADARIAAVRKALADAEKADGAKRGAALTALAAQLEGEVAGSKDAAKVRLLAQSVKDLAKGGGTGMASR
ncbi:MAG: hypothetical protein NW201_03950 [Gemmatimonadales bacterium]|nr:hypothetical protein [Gemmatimonadales bacterium]